MVFAAVKRWTGCAICAAILVVSPACGPDGFTAPWLRGPDPASPYAVNRPAYADGARPFFISGYAGANYDLIPGRPRVAPGAPLLAPVAPPAILSGAPPEPPGGPPAVSVSEGSWQTE